MGQIENIIADLQSARNLYEQNWVLPYGSAYATAKESYDKTLASQAESDKFKAELLLTVATIGFGAGMGAMFGKTAFRAVAVDQALNFVCNRNMIRTFNTMAAISGSMPGTFIVDQVWTFVEGQIGTAAKAMVGQLAQPASSANAMGNPQVFQNDLLQYVLRALNAAVAVAQDVRDSRTMSAADKDRAAAGLRNSAFFRNAPTRNLIGDPVRAAQAIELSMYMPIIMDADYFAEHRTGFRGAHEFDTTTRRGRVGAATTAPGYGQVPAATHQSGPGFSVDTYTTIEYERPGSKILDRVNELHQARFRSDFIANHFYNFGFGREDITRAEGVLNRLNTEVLSWVPVG
jgi:hypothetical protein